MKSNILMLVVLFLFVCINMNAQQRTYLFNQKSRIDLGLNSQQSDKLDTMLNNDIYLNHFFVEINSLVEIHEDGTIYVNLPDKQTDEFFVGKYIEYKDEDDFVYYGELDPCDENRHGTILLIEKNGNVFGQINIEEDIYELQDFGGHKNVLFKIDPEIYTESECGVGDSTQHNINMNPIPLENRNSGICNVRVLVLYTAAANAVNSDPANSATTFIEQTNQIMRNSHANVRFTLAGVELLEDFEEENTASDTLDELKDNEDAQQLRNDFEANMVHLLTEAEWPHGLGFAIGWSYTYNYGDPDFAYSLSNITASGGFYTFSHEIAHNFGCKHDNDDSGPEVGMVFSARGH
jgi:hypothetical protein